MMSTSTTPRLLTVRETAQFLSISPRTLWSLTASGKIPVVRIGRSTRYDIEDLRTFIEAGKRGEAR